MQSETIGRSSEVIRGDQRALRRIQQHSEAMSRTQQHTHLLRREHRHSEALRGTQEAIKRQSSGKRHSPAQVRARALRSLLAAPPEQPTAAATSTHRQSCSGARVATRRGKRGRALPVGRRGRRGEHLHAGSLCGSSRKQGTRAFPHRPGHQWASVVISGHQWSSVVISGHQATRVTSPPAMRTSSPTSGGVGSENKIAPNPGSSADKCVTTTRTGPWKRRLRTVT